MKIIKFILSSLLLALLFSGCKPNADSVPNSYYLKLKFEDSSGRDLVKGIKYYQTDSSSTASGTSYLVDINEYVFQSSVANEPAKSELLRIEINNQYECLYTSYGTFDYVASTITQKLQCPYIFGDNKEHVIISYWYDDSKYNPACLKITCDDKEFQVTKGGQLGEYTALITLTK